MSQHGKYKSKLAGARVLVVGGSSGVGFGVAEALIENGASVIISSSSEDRVSRAVALLQAISHNSSPHVEGYACNLGSFDTLESEVKALFDKVLEGGGLDHVVFTAGDALAIGKLEEFTLKDFQQAGVVRFFAPLVISQHLRRSLKAGLASSFVMTTGGIPEHLMKEWAVIHGYLAGISGLTRGLAVDLSPIRVNSVGLGPVETELWESSKEAGFYDQIIAKFESKMTTQAIGKVEDVVECYLYLMKDRNASGSILYSNGGTLLL